MRKKQDWSSGVERYWIFEGVGFKTLIVETLFEKKIDFIERFVKFINESKEKAS